MVDSIPKMYYLNSQTDSQKYKNAHKIKLNLDQADNILTTVIALFACPEGPHTFSISYWLDPTTGDKVFRQNGLNCGHSPHGEFHQGTGAGYSTEGKPYIEIMQIFKNMWNYDTKPSGTGQEWAQQFFDKVTQ